MTSKLISKMSHLNFFATLTTNKSNIQATENFIFRCSSVLIAKFQWIFIHKLKNQQHTKNLVLC